jgi:hypothetical protein
MKRIMTLILSVLASLMIAYAQVPQAFKYQAIARDANGNPLVNQNIGLRISLLQRDVNGPEVYSEVQNVTTTPYGLIELEIGEGRILSGSFNEIDWKSAPCYLKIEMDINGGTDYHLMGTSELLSVPYALYAEHSGNEDSRAGEWTNDGANIYVAPAFSANYVGIGTSAPADKLHIYGGTSPANFIVESDITGSNSPISRLRLKNRDDGDLFNLSLRRTSGQTEMLQSVYDASATTWREYVYFNVNTRKYEVRSGIGQVEYKNAGHVLFSNSGNVGIGTNAPAMPLHVYMTHPVDNVIFDGGYPFLCFNASASSHNSGITFKEADSNRAWIWHDGINDRLRITTKDNGLRGDLVIANNGNVGIGTDNPYARLDVSYDAYTYSHLGCSDVLGNYFFHCEQGTDDGQAAIFAKRQRESANDGSGYGKDETNTAIKGYNQWGDAYTFGISGYNGNEFTRSGGIIGAKQDGSYWGALAYKTSTGNGYGGYFTNYNTGSGKSDQSVFTGIGVGAWGELMAADFHGNVYGIYTEGNNYALFSHGIVFKDGLDVHLQKNKEGHNTALYTYVSTDVCVQTSGTATLSAGCAVIAFDPAFTAIASSGEPVVVTVTPLGESNGVYLSNVTSSGFTIVENNAGKSNVTVNYIAIGKRAGYENPQLAQEVVEDGYADKMARGLHNDADTWTDGEGLFYEKGKLVVGRHPSTLADPNKPQDEMEIRRKSSFQKEVQQTRVIDPGYGDGMNN